MHVIYVGERGSPDVEKIAGVVVGFDEDHDLKIATTTAGLTQPELDAIAEQLEKQAAALRAGQRHALQ